MIGYKAFDKDLRCRGFQFKVGKTYETRAKKEDLKICSNTVFHFCRELNKLESESPYDLSECRVCEVIAEGEVVSVDDKYGTNKLKILREIPREELNKYRNSGNWNSGNCNSGNWNSGDCNSGDWNSGDWNSGNCNSGNCNSGNRNSGDWNSGNWNSGNRNSGDWNSGNWNSGFFNTDCLKIRMFNRFTDIDRNQITFPDFLYFSLTVWVSYDTATAEEKEEHKNEIEVSGGFLKELSYKEAFRIAWNKAGKKEHLKLLKLPNWDNEIFKEISGIDAEAEIAKEK